MTGLRSYIFPEGKKWRHRTYILSREKGMAGPHLHLFWEKNGGRCWHTKGQGPFWFQHRLGTYCQKVQPLEATRSRPRGWDLSRPQFLESDPTLVPPVDHSLEV